MGTTLVRNIFSPIAVFWVLIALSLQIWIFTIVPIQTALAFGGLSLFIEFLVVIGYFASALDYRLRRYGWPSVGLIVLAAVVFSTFNLNDNHPIRTVAVGDKERLVLSDAFPTWYRSRQDLASYAGGEYPVFVVAAAGGGLYAASHAATVLARLQDHCPNFVQHVFAISGVSGGGLGAALFASLAREFATNIKGTECQFRKRNEYGNFEKLSSDYFAHDFLSPLLAAALFPDFIQRFIPTPVKVFDRARPLEASFVYAWRTIARSQSIEDRTNPFDEPFLSLWNPEGVAPALVLNATNVDTGNPTALAPFALADGFGGPGYLSESFFRNEFMKDFYIGTGLRHRDRDVSLSTAVALSARFPWIMPAGVHHDSSRTLRFVDGGYFENSGVETAVDIIKSLKSIADQEGLKVRVYLVSITGAGFGISKSWNGMGELLSPIRAMLGTRRTRGDLAIARALQDRSHPSSAIMLNLDDFPLPLGWQISSASQLIIGEHSGYPERKVDLTDSDSAILNTVRANDFEVCLIHEFLNPRYKTTDTGCSKWMW